MSRRKRKKYFFPTSPKHRKVILRRGEKEMEPYPWPHVLGNLLKGFSPSELIDLELAGYAKMDTEQMRKLRDRFNKQFPEVEKYMRQVKQRGIKVDQAYFDELKEQLND